MHSGMTPLVFRRNDEETLLPKTQISSALLRALTRQPHKVGLIALMPMTVMAVRPAQASVISCQVSVPQVWSPALLRRFQALSALTP